MKAVKYKAVSQRLRDQHGVISRAQLRAAGVSIGTERNWVASGLMEYSHATVLRSTDTRVSSHQRLMAAVLAGGSEAVASHRSAAWLWDLAGTPDRPEVSVGRNGHGRLLGTTTHKTVLTPESVSFRSGIPCTNALATVVDLAGVVDREALDDVVDKALAIRLVSIPALLAEATRKARPGPGGVGKLRGALNARGFTRVPHPSVLESKLYRLLDSAGIRPSAIEKVVLPDRRYRLDVMLIPGLALEVAGYTHHGSVGSLAYDERRRNALLLSGIEVLTYTWIDVVFDGFRLVNEVRRALDRPAYLQPLGTRDLGT